MDSLLRKRSFFVLHALLLQSSLHQPITDFFRDLLLLLDLDHSDDSVVLLRLRAIPTDRIVSPFEGK